jgi:acyl-lipid omega-6 desaturase (Delta-12 desaturase)
MNSQISASTHTSLNTFEWKAIVAEFQEPSTPRAVWQLVNTLGSYAIVWALMLWCHTVSWWLTLPLAVLAAGLLVRVFIIFHDCGHGSFFKSRLANDIFGFITGMFTFTPYHHWRWEHSLHHASSGDLDRRGTGDLWTMTVQEYLDSSKWKRFLYRLARNPIVLFALAPIFLFIFRERFPSTKAKPRERRSVWWMNSAILAKVIALAWAFGIKDYLIIQLLIMIVSGGLGVWLFYVQHQFDGAYWERGDNWDYTAAALQGSSFYRLPRILQWFSGNIGYHHIHHLSPRIPNYNLQRCHDSHPLFREVKPITLFGSLKLITYHLWDEHRGKLVSFRQVHRSLKAIRKSASSQAAVATTSESQPQRGKGVTGAETTRVAAGPSIP